MTTTSTAAPQHADDPRPPPCRWPLVTLGCARNEVDSEELAGRLEADGFRLVDDPARRRHRGGQHLRLRGGRQEGLGRHAAPGRRPQGVRADPGRRRRRLPRRAVRQGPRRVAARGRRRARLRRLPRHRGPAALDRGGGDPPPAHARRTAAGCCRSRRWSGPPARSSVPGHASSGLDELGVGAPATGPRAVRRRLDGGPMAPLKLASGCDRRCSFCAIPSFRGSFVSRRPSDVLAEARWLASRACSELFLVSENSTSYGKDLGDLRLLETLLPELARRRRRRAGAGLLPAARRDPARPDRGDRHDARAWRRTSTSPSSTPARDGAAPDAPLRRPGELPGPARADPRVTRRRPASGPT